MTGYAGEKAVASGIALSEYYRVCNENSYLDLHIFCSVIYKNEPETFLKHISNLKYNKHSLKGKNKAACGLMSWLQEHLKHAIWGESNLFGLQG